MNLVDTCHFKMADLQLVAAGAAITVLGFALMLALLARWSPLGVVLAVRSALFADRLSLTALLRNWLLGSVGAQWVAPIVQLGLIGGMLAFVFLIPFIGGMGWVELATRLVGMIWNKAYDVMRPVTTLLFMFVAIALLFTAWYRVGAILATLLTIGVGAMILHKVVSEHVGEEHAAVQRMSCAIREYLQWPGVPPKPPTRP